MRLRIVIAPDGSSSVKVEGIVGPSCHGKGLDLAKELGTVTQDLKTTEYFQAPAVQQKAKKEVTA
jgi:hypothetical protein